MIRWNEQRYRHTFESRGGTVGVHLTKVAFRLETTAKLIATEEKLVRTGRYRSSLAARLLNEAGGLVVKFGSAVPHARFLEHGTEPHIIRAVNKKALWWDMPNDRGWMVQPDHGRPVPYVQHPGNRAYQVLRRALLIVTKGGTAR